MLMNIAHVRGREPKDRCRSCGHPKMRKAAPRPKVSDSAQERNRKNGSKFDPGATAGGQINGPAIKAGMPNKSVTDKTLIQGFMASFPFCDGCFKEPQCSGRWPTISF